LPFKKSSASCSLRISVSVFTYRTYHSIDEETTQVATCADDTA
jgi:hypothetical protein